MHWLSWPPLWLALFLCPCPSAAAPALTLPEALADVPAEHPDVAVARRELEAAEAALAQAGAHPNPVLGTELIDTRRATRESSVQLSQPIELGGKRAARVSAAERERDIARLRLAALQAAVRSAVVGAFFDALMAQQHVQLALAAAETARSGQAAATRRVAAGQLSPVEETKARVAEAGVRVELLQARGELTIALQALAAALGRPDRAPERVDGSALGLPAVPTAAEVDARLPASPALRLARLEVERRQALVGVERAQRVPDLTVSLGVRRLEEAGRNQAIVGFSLPLPLFDRNQGGLQQALRREDQARDALASATLQLQAEARQARERLASASAQALALQQDLLPDAQSACDAALRGFELGKFSFLDVLDAQRTLLHARDLHLRAIGQAHRARIDLDRTLGTDDRPASHQP